MVLLYCGQTVETIHGKIQGTITGITIRFDTVAYEISYFKDAEKMECWLNRCEFTVLEKAKYIQIGFNKN